MTAVNYRLVCMDVSHPGKEWYEVHTIYTKDDGSLWSKGSVELSGPGRHEVQHELHLIAADVFGSESVLESSLGNGPRDELSTNDEILQEE